MKHPRLDPARFFGEIGGGPVALFRMRHASGMEVAVCNLGAKVLHIGVPDGDGALGDAELIRKLCLRVAVLF
jgi:aldose 1-epimerase